MARIGIIRCEKNQDRCPLTSCLRCLGKGVEGFARYAEPGELVGVFTCRCPGDAAPELAAILKAKGAEVVHFCTCVTAGKVDGQWTLGHGFCPDPESLLARVSDRAGIPCVLGTAHLPQGYEPRVF